MSRSEDIGANIKKIRLERGLTQKQLGDLCGMADSAIRRYESGRGNPTNKTLMRIAAALNVSIEVLMFSDERFKVNEEWLGSPIFSSVEEREVFFSEIKETLEFRDAYRMAEFVNSTNGRMIIAAYSELNEFGQREAAKRILELTELKDYQLTRTEPPTSEETSDTDTDITAKEKPPKGNTQPNDGE